MKWTTPKARRWCVVVAALACFVADVPTPALAAPPAVGAFSASSASLPAGGGQVTLAAQASNASTCAFSSVPATSGLPSSLDCSSGSGSVTLTLPANTVAKALVYTFHLAATGTKTVNAPAVTVSVAGFSSTVVHQCGSISISVVWNYVPGRIFQVDCPVRVDSGATLTVASGVIVKLAPSAGLSVADGSLVVNGTAASPVALTSVLDDSEAGDTNGTERRHSPLQVTGRGSP